MLFLDRGHARAKAYIDRARSAIAERQREGDELLHTGAAAFDRGDAGTARALLELGGRARGGDRRGARRCSSGWTVSSRRVCARCRRRPHGPLVDASSLAGRSRGPERIVARSSWMATGVLAGLAAAGVVAWIAVARPELVAGDRDARDARHRAGRASRCPCRRRPTSGSRGRAAVRGRPPARRAARR